MKTLLLALLSFLGFSTLQASEAGNALNVLIESFARMDTVYRQIGEGKDKENDAFIASLRKESETLGSMKSVSNPDLREPFADFSDILLDVSNDLEKGGFRAVRGKLVFLQHVCMGVAVGISRTDGIGLRLSEDEIKGAFKLIEERFGDKVKNDQINGDTPFARSISFVYGFLKSAK
jgi:hypothetical protein